MKATFCSLGLISPLLLSAYAAPVFEKRQTTGPGSSYACASQYNTPAMKTSLIDQGADARDLAITILETGCNMDGTSYPLGDTYPSVNGANPVPKTGDAANFGLFKNNWGSIREHCSEFQGMDSSDYLNGAVLNDHPTSAIKCLHEQINSLGIDGFYQVQRGVPGEGPEYGQAVDYIHNYLDEGHLHDDEVTSYSLAAV